MRSFWKRVQGSRQKLISALFVNSDNRLYTDINVAGHHYVALLDSGASISCIGGTAAKVLGQHPKMSKCSGKIRTANNDERSVVGRLECEITYREIIKPVQFFVIPDLKQDVYLGKNFWRDFGLLSKILDSKVSVSELDVGREDVAVESPKVHVLSAQQKERLDLVINKLPSYEKNGLGRTHLVEHIIDVADAKPVKQRHWPISPAKEDLMFSELENMLALGVIEESKSPWSSNCVLVRKGQKVRLCLDSREVNKLTIKDACPLPHIDGILS